LHSSCQQHLQEHNKTYTVLACNIYKNTIKLAQVLPATFTRTPQNLDSSCQQHLQEHHKTCTVLASNIYKNTTKIAQLMTATFYPTPCKTDEKKFVPLAYTQDPANWARSDPMAK
jgi:hypothetical protein